MKGEGVQETFLLCALVAMYHLCVQKVYLTALTRPGLWGKGGGGGDYVRWLPQCPRIPSLLWPAGFSGVCMVLIEFAPSRGTMKWSRICWHFTWGANMAGLAWPRFVYGAFVWSPVVTSELLVIALSCHQFLTNCSFIIISAWYMGQGV